MVMHLWLHFLCSSADLHGEIRYFVSTGTGSVKVAHCRFPSFLGSHRVLSLPVQFSRAITSIVSKRQAPVAAPARRFGSDAHGHHASAEDKLFTYVESPRASATG
jgi:hypothetical protein